MLLKSLVTGAAVAVAGRALLVRGLQAKFERDLRLVNAGDHSSLLRAYADDAVLRFNVGDHRFSGDWQGREQVDRFLQNFTAAGLQGQITNMAVSGPPWAMTLWAQFDDHADAPSGERIYAAHTTIVLKTRWGKIVEHEDFWVDTAPIIELDRKLTALGVAPVPKAG